MRESNLRSSLQELNLLMPLTAYKPPVKTAFGGKTMPDQQEYIHDIRTFARISYYHYSTVKADIQGHYRTTFQFRYDVFF